MFDLVDEFLSLETMGWLGVDAIDRIFYDEAIKKRKIRRPKRSKATIARGNIPFVGGYPGQMVFLKKKTYHYWSC